jgi:hypothetical protein
MISYIRIRLVIFFSLGYIEEKKTHVRIQFTLYEYKYMELSIVVREHQFIKSLNCFNTIYLVLSAFWFCDLKKCDLKIRILKCVIWKSDFLKTQLSVWRNRILDFKFAILSLKFCVFKKTINILPTIWKSRFYAF